MNVTTANRYLAGNYGPVRDELTATDLPVTGALPDFGRVSRSFARACSFRRGTTTSISRVTFFSTRSLNSFSRTASKLAGATAGSGGSRAGELRQVIRQLIFVLRQALNVVLFQDQRGLVILRVQCDQVRVVLNFDFLSELCNRQRHR